MAGVLVSLQLFKVPHDSGANRVQVDVTDKFHKIRFFLHHKALVAVLEKVTLTFVTPVVCDGMLCHQPPHGRR